MRDEKIIKIEKRQILIHLSNLYITHNLIIDHIAETNKTCVICQDIQTLKTIILKLDNELYALRS